MRRATTPHPSANDPIRIALPPDDRRADDPVHIRALDILARDLGAKTVADVFGLDAHMAERFRKAGRSIERVDLGSDRSDAGFDLALVADVLARLPEADVDRALAAIRELSANVAFIISLSFADRVLGDGKNAHRTIRSKDWWVERILAHFDQARLNPFRGPNEICITTWAPSPHTTARLTRVRKTEILKKVVPDLISRPARHAVRRIQPGFLSDADLAERARDKSIAIVGNSPKLTQARHGPDIDGHDIVVRLKRCPIMDVGSHGTRTDWFATAVNFDMDLFRDRDPSLFLWLTYRNPPPVRTLFLPCPVYCAGRSDLERATSRLGTPPSIGFIAVDIILSLPAEKVTIYGFDGMKSASLSSQFVRQTKVIHDHTSEMDVIELMAGEHGRTHIVPLD